MKRIDLSGLRTLVMLLVLAACSTEHEEERIYFEISQSISNGFQSTDGKPQDSSISFNTGDIIGVFLTEQGSQLSTDSYLYNQACIFDGNQWSLGKRFSFPAENKGQKMRMVAYYPFMQPLVNAVLPFEVATLQNNANKQKESDLLFAEQEYIISEAAVDIHFSHLMSQVTFQVDYANGISDVCSNIYLKACNQCSLNLENGAVSTHGTVTSIEALKLKEETSDNSSRRFSLLIPPQHLSDEQAIELKINESPFFIKLDQTFDSGVHYIMHLTVLGDRQVTLNGVSVASWESVNVTQGSLYSPETYSTGDVIVYQKMREKHPVTLVVTGDGFTTNELAPNGLFESSAREALNCLFSVEPYKSYREYFNVYILPTVSEETGAGNTDTGKMRNTYFKTSWGNNYSDMQVKDYNEIFDFVSSTCPDIIENKTSIDKVPVFLLVNDSRYGGICWIWNNGLSYAIIPLTEGNLQWSGNSSIGISTGDWKNVFVHEGGGHGFGKLLDEYHYNDSPNYTAESIESQAWEVPLGLNLTTDFNNTKGSVYWKHLLNDSRYPRTGFFEGGMGYKSGIWHSEITSCMDDNRLYFNTISRQLIVERIKTIAGEPFVLEEFFAKDINYDPLRDFNSFKTSDQYGIREKARQVPRTPHTHLMK